ncbi:MAG: macro domain-containing protein [Bdellovibrionaceae bacterium]|nr:macro domain-containing protein [Pseudobdellovibrionaceae bacterium]
MIKYVTGDLLMTKASAVAHGVAPNDNFAQGLALSLRENWPSMYKDFRHYSHTHNPSEGEVWSWKGVQGPVIINLFTQERAENNDSRPGKASESHVNHALKHLVQELKKLKLTSVALPKIATGVGALSWEKVKPLMEKHLSELDIPVYIYEKYSKGEQAKEDVV